MRLAAELRSMGRGAQLASHSCHSNEENKACKVVKNRCAF